MIKQEYRLIQDEDSHWYVIPVGEEETFVKWMAAMAGCRHLPAHFDPIRVDGPHTVAFTGWREET